MPTQIKPKLLKSRQTFFLSFLHTWGRYSQCLLACFKSSSFAYCMYLCTCFKSFCTTHCALDLAVSNAPQKCRLLSLRCFHSLSTHTLRTLYSRRQSCTGHAGRQVYWDKYCSFSGLAGQGGVQRKGAGCHWQELPQASFLLWQKFCCDKRVCCDKHIFWQNCYHEKLCWSWQT